MRTLIILAVIALGLSGCSDESPPLSKEACTQVGGQVRTFQVSAGAYRAGDVCFASTRPETVCVVQP